MAEHETARKILEEIRDPTRLGHLRRRPRCADGTLDMRHKVNKGLSKLEMTAEFYDPAQPAVLVEEAVIRQLRADQQARYDEARFRVLTARVAKLEKERSTLLRYREKARQLLQTQRTQLDRLQEAMAKSALKLPEFWDRLWQAPVEEMPQPQD